MAREREKRSILVKEDTGNKVKQHGLEGEKKFSSSLKCRKGTCQRGRGVGGVGGDKTQEDRERKSEVVRARVWPSAYRK